MSQDSKSHVGKFLPSEEPTFTADASLAFELQYGLLPANGISRLSCADPNAIDCFVPRELPDRSKYHNSIPRDEYERFKKPGRSWPNTLRVWRNTLPHANDDFKSQISTGNWEGHKFRNKDTTAIFTAALDKDGKWKEDIPMKGWVTIPGTLQVSCTVVWVLSAQNIMGTYTDVNPGLGPR
jgi:hypothetical protein